MALILREGDFIGETYEVRGFLGGGGFGVVYLVYSHETGDVYALETLRDEHLNKSELLDLFRKEDQVWVDLERHPYVFRSHWVDEVATGLRPRDGHGPTRIRSSHPSIFLRDGYCPNHRSPRKLQQEAEL